MQVPTRNVDNQLTLRSATREDAHACAGILKQGADDGLVARTDEVDASAIARQILGASAARNSLFLVAVEQDPRYPNDPLTDVVLGLLLLEGAPLMRLHDVARVTMAVAPHRRGQGIGRALLEYTMECADKSGAIRKIELLTRANNERAIRLYTHMGFAEEGRLRARLGLEDGTYLDDVCMARFRPTVVQS